MSVMFDQKVLNGLLLLKFDRFSIYLYHTDFGILFIGEIPYDLVYIYNIKRERSKLSTPTNMQINTLDSHRLIYTIEIFNF